MQLNCNYKRNKKLALEVHCKTDDTSLRAIMFVTSWHTRAGHSPLHHAKACVYIPDYCQVCISITFPMNRKSNVTKKKKNSWNQHQATCFYPQAWLKSFNKTMPVTLVQVPFPSAYIQTTTATLRHSQQLPSNSSVFTHVYLNVPVFNKFYSPYN